MDEKIKEIRKQLQRLYDDFNKVVKPLQEQVRDYTKLEREKLLAPYLNRAFRLKTSKETEFFLVERIDDFHDLSGTCYALDAGNPENRALSACKYGLNLKTLLEEWEEIPPAQLTQSLNTLFERLIHPILR